jgi:NAD-dependent SIR2 family protein deacetylase
MFNIQVDGHFAAAGFTPVEIYEIHGSVDSWQCSLNCKGKNWSTPSDFYFEIDEQIMEAPNVDVMHSDPLWRKNHPICLDCQNYARPSILMWGDTAFHNNATDAAADRYWRWKKAVAVYCQQNPEAKLAILEIGCGKTVPSVR